MWRKCLVILLVLACSACNILPNSGTSFPTYPGPSSSSEESTESEPSYEPSSSPSEISFPTENEPSPAESEPSPTESESPSPTENYSNLEPLEIAKGPVGEGRVVLTFDCGAGRGYPEEIVDILLKYNVPATFFLTGQWIEDNPNDLQMFVQNGFDFGNHSWSHPDLTTLSDEEIIDQITSVEEKTLELTGRSTKPLFRVPYGARDDRVLEILASQGYYSIYWTVDSLDWQEDKSPEWVKERVLSRLEDGAIILSHIASPYTYLVLDQIIEGIEAQGYQIVPLRDFLP